MTGGEWRGRLRKVRDSLFRQGSLTFSPAPGHPPLAQTSPEPEEIVQSIEVEQATRSNRFIRFREGFLRRGAQASSAAPEDPPAPSTEAIQPENPEPVEGPHRNRFRKFRNTLLRREVLIPPSTSGDATPSQPEPPEPAGQDRFDQFRRIRGRISRRITLPAVLPGHPAQRDPPLHPTSNEWYPREPGDEISWLVPTMAHREYRGLEPPGKYISNYRRAALPMASSAQSVDSDPQEGPSTARAIIADPQEGRSTAPPVNTNSRQGASVASPINQESDEENYPGPPGLSAKARGKLPVYNPHVPTSSLPYSVSTRSWPADSASAPPDHSSSLYQESSSRTTTPSLAHSSRHSPPESKSTSRTTLSRSSSGAPELLSAAPGAAPIPPSAALAPSSSSVPQIQVTPPPTESLGAGTGNPSATEGYGFPAAPSTMEQPSEDATPPPSPSRYQHRRGATYPPNPSDGTPSTARRVRFQELPTRRRST